MSLNVQKFPHALIVTIDTGDGATFYGFSTAKPSRSPEWHLPAPRLVIAATSGRAEDTPEREREAMSAAYEALGFPADFRPWLPRARAAHLSRLAPRVERRPIRRPLPRGLYIP